MASRKLSVTVCCAVVLAVMLVGQVYNLKQAKRDISSIYATGLFEDVNITPKEADDSTESAPKVRYIHARYVCVYVCACSIASCVQKQRPWQTRCVCMCVF